MKSKTVSIPYSQMKLYVKESVINKPDAHTELKLVVYIDSFHCSECEMKKIHLWDDFVKLEHKYDGHFKVIFIVQTRKKTTFNDMVSAFCHYEVEYPIYIDSESVFSKQNPHISSENMYHVFLLNENNDVMLVGNPLFNSDIENRLLQIIEQRL